MSDYIEGHILTPWRHLTLSLTNHAAERFNRKIEQCFSGRDGIPSPESAAVLLRSLWFKELLLNGQQHLEATSSFRTLDLPTACQEYLKTSNILHFFHDHTPELLEKLGEIFEQWRGAASVPERKSLTVLRACCKFVKHGGKFHRWLSISNSLKSK